MQEGQEQERARLPVFEAITLPEGKTLGDLHGMIARAVDAKIEELYGDRVWGYVEEVFDGVLIMCVRLYEENGAPKRRMLRIGWRVEGEGVVLDGEPVEVTRKVVYEPVSTTAAHESVESPAQAITRAREALRQGRNAEAERVAEALIAAHSAREPLAAALAVDLSRVRRGLTPAA